MNKLILSCLTAICILSCGQNESQNNSKTSNKRNLALVVINLTKNEKAQFKYIDYFGTSQLMPFPKTDTLVIKNSHPIVTYHTQTRDFSDLTYYTLSAPDTVDLKMDGNKEILISNNKVLKNKINLMSQLLFNVGSMNYSRNKDFVTGINSINDFYLKKKAIIESNKNNIDDKILKTQLR